MLSRAARIVGLCAIVSVAIRTFCALRWYGFQTGDDLEIAEEAFRVATGITHTAWNIRNLLVPDLLVAPFIKLATLCGVHDPLSLAAFARAPFLLLGGINVVLVFVLGRRWYDDRTAAIAASLYAFHWIPIVYGSSSYPRTLAVTCILGAVLLLDRATAPFAFIAGLLAALAVTTRYSEAIFVASLLVIARGRRNIAALLAGFAIGVVLFIGFYDRLTWGRWFSSAIEFARLTFERRDASSLNTHQPPWWYLTSLPQWMPLTTLPLIIVATMRGELRRFIAFIALPLLVLSAIFHKELRYLQVVVPFVMLIAAAGFAAWPRRRAIAFALLVLAYPLALGRITGVTRRSTNAVDAALWIAQRQPRGIALSQAWAYGGRLFIDNRTVIADIDIPPDPRRIRELSPAITMLAVYTSEADAATLRASGFTNARTFDGHGGRSVSVFTR
jgi:4-amino-4-deoxy-L-arabinose transferase-like glycosyltransferase